MASVDTLANTRKQPRYPDEEDPGVSMVPIQIGCETALSLATANRETHARLGSFRCQTNNAKAG